MPDFRSGAPLRRLLVAAGLLVALASAAAPRAVYTPQASFDTTIGHTPARGLTRGTGGALYGMTSHGGAHGCGTLFRRAADGSVVPVRGFSYEEGCQKDGALTAMPDGSLWGTAVSGGLLYGTVFRFDPASGAFNVIHTFVGSDGNMPRGRLLHASDGWVYGTTMLGGAQSDGVIYRIHASSGGFQLMHSFSLAQPFGVSPMAGLIKGADGQLYGSTSAGSAPNGVGSLFRLDPLTGVVTLVHDFARASGPSEFELTLGPDGTLYGTTIGVRNHDAGTLFALRPDGAFEVVYRFENRHGVYPNGTLLLASDGFLYGNTFVKEAARDNEGRSMAFRIRTDGQRYQTLHLYADNDALGGFVQVGQALWNVTWNPQEPLEPTGGLYTLTPQH